MTSVPVSATAAKGYQVPLVGDFHYNGHTLLKEFDDCAEALDKYRINPGNVGQGDKRDARFCEMVEQACIRGRILRDAKLYEIGAGTSEIRRMLIARELFNESV